MFRSLAILALAVSSAVATEVAAGAGLNAGPINAAAGLDVNLGEKTLDLPQQAPGIVVPQPGTASRLTKSRRAAHRHVRRTGSVDLEAHIATPLLTACLDLHVDVGGVIKEVEGLVEGVAGGAVEGVVEGVQTHLTTLVSTLQGGVKTITALPQAATGSDSKNGDAPSADAIADPLSAVYSEVGQLFQTLHGIEDQVPGLGPVLSAATTEVQSVLSNLLGVVGQIAKPVLDVLKPLLAPVEGLLNDLGLCPVTDLINSILGL